MVEVNNANVVSADILAINGVARHRYSVDASCDSCAYLSPDMSPTLPDNLPTLSPTGAASVLAHRSETGCHGFIDCLVGPLF
jgi:hypothetical protein